MAQTSLGVFLSTLVQNAKNILSSQVNCPDQLKNCYYYQSQKKDTEGIIKYAAAKDWNDLYSPRNDPDPEMIPNPEMIPKSTPK